MRRCDKLKRTTKRRAETLKERDIKLQADAASPETDGIDVNILREREERREIITLRDNEGSHEEKKTGVVPDEPRVSIHPPTLVLPLLPSTSSSFLSVCVFLSCFRLLLSWLPDSWFSLYSTFSPCFSPSHSQCSSLSFCFLFVSPLRSPFLCLVFFSLAITLRPKTISLSDPSSCLSLLVLPLPLYLSDAHAPTSSHLVFGFCCYDTLTSSPHSLWLGCEAPRQRSAGCCLSRD